MTELRTERLLLRAARDGECEALHRIYANPAAMRYWDTPPHASPEDTRTLYEALRHRHERRLYFAWDLGGDIVGTGGLHTGNQLGVILHPDHWGKGLAREGVEAIIDLVWKATDFEGIAADVDPRNLASVGLLTRLGFHVTGFRQNTICVSGTWCDSVYLALPRPAP